MTYHGIKIPGGQIATFCRRNHIRQLSLFGSVLSDEFRSDSDIDMLVEFQPGYSVGLIGIARLEHELTGMIGRKVDLRTPAELSRYFREEVMKNCQVQYAEE